MSSSVVRLPNLSGCAVDNRYYLRNLIGWGAFGVVYQAVDLRARPTEDPSRAVKVIPKVGRQPHEIAMFRREAAFHAVVSHHPNVVSLRDVYEDDEYMYNDNLLRAAFVSLIDAVQACHEAGIAHRDLKPENVLLSKDCSQIYLADFGIATGEHMVDSFGCGTLSFLLPSAECAGPQPYCALSNDIWGLGVILVNMISSMDPWEEASMKDTGFARFCQEPNFLYDSLPVSEGAHAILLSIFALCPLRRISLPMLRQMVLEVDTFFRAPTDTMAAVDITKRKYAEACYQQQPQPQVYAQPAYQEPDSTKQSYFTPPGLEHMHHPAARKEESHYISTDSSSYSSLSSTGAWSASDTYYAAPVADAASADASSYTSTFLSPRAMEARWLEDYDLMAEKFREHYYPTTPSHQAVFV